MKKQLLLFVMMLLPTVASADDSGSCGENVTWIYVEATHTLKISGSGEMENFSYFVKSPWTDYCTEIVNLIIEDGVTSIGNSAFRECSNLTSVDIPNSVTSIGNSAFCECSSLTSVDIPNSVTSIGEDAFSANSITTLTIPDNVTRVGGYAFRNCKELTTIVIGKSVVELGQSAFNGCNKVSQITIYAENPPTHDYWPNSTFDGVDHTIPVYVPAGCVLKYKASKLFGDFVIIREISEMDNDIYLTIHDGEHGSIKLKMDKANPYATFKFEASSGWKVYSVTLNGESVKEYIDAAGNYTTPAINSNSVLNIVYAEGSTDIASHQSSDLQFSTSVNTIIVNGTKGDERINVYTLDGVRVESLRAFPVQTIITLESSQTYLVKVDKDTFKIRL